MTRPIPPLCALLLLCSAAAAEEVTYEALRAEPTRSKEMDEGEKRIRKYYEYQDKVASGDLKLIPKEEEAIRFFRKWLDATPETMGIDLRGYPEVVLRIIDEGHVPYLAKYRTGGIEYFKRSAAGWRRGQFEYSVLVPKDYKPKDQRYPLVVSLHERAIEPKHPAFKNKAEFAERSRKTIHDNWLKKPAGDEVVVVAPTGSPDGFKYEPTKHEDRQYEDRQALFIAMGIGLSSYRTDWNRVFLEVHGPALRLAIEQSLMFAGIIVRDREDDARPLLSADDAFLLDNLNGTPLCYVADQQTWDRVGAPLADWLTQYYQRIGKPENLVVMKVPRDADGALQADGEKLRAFVKTHVRPRSRSEIVWRFPDANGTSPTPIEITDPNFALKVSEAAEKQPMSALAGAMRLRVTQDTGKDAEGNDSPFNKVEIDITEAESLRLYLYDGFVNLGLPITVVVNGEVVHDRVKVERDWDYFVDNILPRAFFMLPVTASLECEFPHKPQFVPPEEATKEEPPKEGEGTAGADSGEDASTTESVQTEKPPK